MTQNPSPPAELFAVHLRGPRVQLVPQDAALHLDNYLRWLNDPEVTRYTMAVTPLTRLDEEKFFKRVSESDDTVSWAVHDERGRHIGVTALHGWDRIHRKATSGIIIGAKDAWGQGYGSEVMQVRTRFAFEELGLHRIESECYAENIGSATCLERAGYRRIGIARKRLWAGGRWHDTILWEILDEDYFAAQAPGGGKAAAAGEAGA